MKKLILIDGNAILHRAYHSMPAFKTANGEVVNAVYGFTRMILELFKKEKPDYVAVAWDRAAPTFRHTEFKEYKAHRSPPPDDLYPQLPRVKQVLAAFQIPFFEIDGYEADDILGTLSDKTKNEPELQTIILTGDRDTFQLVGQKTFVMMPLVGLSQVAIYNPEEVLKKMGVLPEQIIDYKALCGDPSDNIPGVPGIGSKQAQELLTKYGTLENIYSHLSELSSGQQKKLTEGRESAMLSKKLATIQLDAPINFQLEQCQTHIVDFSKTKMLLEELEFKSLIKKLEDLQPKNTNEPVKIITEPANTIQQSLF